jgi:uncharacterized protein (TIGR00725 family)
VSADDPALRLRRVAVVGSGTDTHAELAGPLGRLIAGMGAHLVTGGGGGVMAEVARAFVETPGRAGLSIGVLPAAEGTRVPEPPAGYPNRWVEIPVVTHLTERGARGHRPYSRNHLVVLSGEAVVALPGGAGTASEILLALRYRRPVLAFTAGRPFAPAIPDGVPSAEQPSEIARWLDDRLR